MSDIDISARFGDAYTRAYQDGRLDRIRQISDWRDRLDEFTLFVSSLGSIPEELQRESIQRNNLQKESIPEGETLECPICKDNIHCECMVTKCGHKYCANCINQWMNEHSTCPYCRQNL